MTMRTDHCGALTAADTGLGGATSAGFAVTPA